MNDDPHDTIFPLPVWFVIAVLFLFGCPSVNASPLFKSKDKNDRPVSLRLLNEPCREKVAVHIKPQFVHLFKRSTLLWDGKYWESFWVEVDGVVMSVDEEGAPFQPVLRDAFLEDTV